MSEVRPKKLTRDECLARLATATIGRVVYTEHALPTAQPVGFFLDDEEVIFRAGRGAGLGAAVNNHVVAFQADDIDDATHAGWSVCGVGEAYEIADPARLTELAALAPAAWTSAKTAPMVSIPLQRLSGRQLVLADATS